MGLSAALTGGIMMTMIVIILIMAIPAVINANVSMNRAYSERALLDDVLSKTSIKLDSLSALPLSNVVTIAATNDGSSKLWNYEKFNILVTYNSTNGITSGKITETLDYAGITTAANIPAGSWGITKFTGDGMDPQILNPNESLEITCKLSNNIALQGFLTVILSTDNGMTTSKSGVIS